MAENFFGITDIGRVRDNNEDAFIARTILNRQFIMACVIDGVGGYEGGEVAAAIAKDSFLDLFQKPQPDVINAMQRAFNAANEKIYKEKIESGKNASMACVATLAVVDIKNNKFYYAHVGDTRLYLLRDHSLVKVTKDQSFVGFLEDSGRLTEEEAMSHPKRNEINKALGFDGQGILNRDYIETGESPFLPGDMILLCSDGLTDLVNNRNMTDILEKKVSLEQKANELVTAANEAGGKDNITVVLVQNTKKPVKPEIKKPVLVNKRELENIVRPGNEPIQLAQATSLSQNGPAKKTSKRNNGVIILLAILCLVFLVGFVWLLLKQNGKISADIAAGKTGKNPQEVRLQALINGAASDTIVLNNATLGSTIYLSDTIWVRRDTVYLKGGDNATLVRHGSFGSGPAIVVTPQCKSIVLDSITLQDFSVGVLTSNPNALQLKNTRFKNCAIAVGYTFGPDDAFINGKFSRQQNDNNSVPPKR